MKTVYQCINCSENTITVGGGVVKKKKARTLKFGDVVGIDLGFYQHFGIYIGDSQMIHYYPVDGDMNGIITIHITSFETFLGEEVEYYICDFTTLLQKTNKEEKEKKIEKELKQLLSPSLNLSSEFDKTKRIYRTLITEGYKEFSPEETVERAYSRLGEICENRLNDNCEHFAIWCKTGIEKKKLCNELIKLIKTFWIT